MYLNLKCRTETEFWMKRSKVCLCHSSYQPISFWWSNCINCLFCPSIYASIYLIPLFNPPQCHSISFYLSIYLSCTSVCLSIYVPPSVVLSFSLCQFLSLSLLICLVILLSFFGHSSINLSLLFSPSISLHFSIICNRYAGIRINFMFIKDPWNTRIDQNIKHKVAESK